VSGNPALIGAGAVAFGGPGTKAIAAPTAGKVISGTATEVDDDEIPFDDAGTATAAASTETTAAPAAPAEAPAVADAVMSDSDIDALIADM
jgi:hypothetical protein